MNELLIKVRTVSENGVYDTKCIKNKENINILKINLELEKSKIYGLQIIYDKENIVDSILKLVDDNSLEVVYIDNSPINFLLKLSSITHLSINNVDMNDLYILKECKLNKLSYLTINSIKKFDILFLKDCCFLELFYIDLSDNNIKSIKSIKKWNFPKLNTISLISNNITDIRYIENIKIEQIYFSFNKIKNCLPLYTGKGIQSIIQNNPLIRRFYDLPYKRYLPKKRMLDKTIAGKINIADIRNIINQYIDLLYTNELIKRVKQNIQLSNNFSFTDI